MAAFTKGIIIITMARERVALIDETLRLTAKMQSEPSLKAQLDSTSSFMIKSPFGDQVPRGFESTTGPEEHLTTTGEGVWEQSNTSTIKPGPFQTTRGVEGKLCVKPSRNHAWAGVRLGHVTSHPQMRKLSLTENPARSMLDL